MAFEEKGVKDSLFSSLQDVPRQHLPEGTEAEADHAIKAWRHCLWFVPGQPTSF